MKIGKVTWKEYYCPACGNKEKHQTNHYSEIYCMCKSCGNGVLYCSEVESPKPEAECRLVKYYHNLEKPGEESKYREMERYLRGKGYDKFDAVIRYKELEAYQRHDGETIGLFNVEQFDNQIVSTIGRVFYWFEGIYPNKKIKTGYYLEFDK